LLVPVVGKLMNLASHLSSVHSAVVTV